MKVLKNNFYCLALVICSFVTMFAFADGVRIVRVRGDEIAPIYLNLGKSTVLRFRERPKKIVIGNQNYFGVEYIDNDVALQPTGAVKTNLFVYTESRTYGFHLIVGSSRYDDLVRVEWDLLQNSRKRLAEPSVSRRFEKKKVFENLSVLLGKDILLKVLKIQYSPAHDMYVLDMTITNKSNSPMDFSKLKLIANRKGVSLSRQILVKEAELINAKGSGLLRLFFKPEKQDDISISIDMNTEHVSFNVAKVYLK